MEISEVGKKIEQPVKSELDVRQEAKNMAQRHERQLLAIPNADPTLVIQRRQEFKQELEKFLAANESLLPKGEAQKLLEELLKSPNEEVSKILT